MSREQQVRRAWAAKYLAVGVGAPAYGTAEWLALPDGPLKVAAVVRAAECWVRESEELPTTLRAEIDALRAAYKTGEDDGFRVRSESHRRAWDGRAGCFRPDPRIAAEVEQDWREWVGEAG